MYLTVKRESGHDSKAMGLQRLTPERRRELTRTALIEAAAEVFSKRGFQAASLEEIAEAAGFTRGAIYSNFGGKEDLLIAVLDLLTEQQLAAFSDMIERESDDRTAAAGAIWSNTQREQRLPILSLEMRAHAMRNPEFRKRLAQSERKHQEQIARFIEQVAEREHRPLSLPARELADMLRAFSDGLSQLAAVDDAQAAYYQSLAARFFAMIEQMIPEERSRPAKA